MFYPLFLFVIWFSQGNLAFGAISSRMLQLSQMLQLPTPTIGPEGLGFSPTGDGPYASVADGRVLKYMGNSTGFVDFSFASPSRSKQCCDGSSDPANETTCGRPLGLAFNNQTGDLYFADAYHGLHVVGPAGGRATLLATEAEGVPFKFLNAVDANQETGIVYFTDASSRFQRREFQRAVLAGDKTGRLMKYDPRTKQVTVLLSGLSLAVGVAVSRDGSFVLVSEFTAVRILRYWLTGPKANTSELFVVPPGTPDNITRNERGEFWVAATVGAEMAAAVPLGIRVSEEGEILEVVTFNMGDITKSISQVHEYNRELYVGSLAFPFVGVFSD